MEKIQEMISEAWALFDDKKYDEARDLYRKCYEKMTADDRLYDDWVKEQNDWLEVVLSEYTLNDLEKSVIDDYRRICRISMYPNVMNYLEFLEKDKDKAVRFLRRIICA